MIHFDFIVSDEEADDIFSILREAQLREWEQSHLNTYENAYRKWMRERSEYLKELILKMDNRGV